MNIEYLPSFLKDLKDLRGTPVYQAVYAIAFEEILEIKDLRDIQNLKKMKGDTSAYRIRVGNYRIGMLITATTITFSRVLHRRDERSIVPFHDSIGILDILGWLASGMSHTEILDDFPELTETDIRAHYDSEIWEFSKCELRKMEDDR